MMTTSKKLLHSWSQPQQSSEIINSLYNVEIWPSAPTRHGCNAIRTFAENWGVYPAWTRRSCVGCSIQLAGNILHVMWQGRMWFVVHLSGVAKVIKFTASFLLDTWLLFFNYEQDRTLRLWNPHKGLAIKQYVGHGYDVRDVTISSDNSK